MNKFELLEKVSENIEAKKMIDAFIKDLHTTYNTDNICSLGGDGIAVFFNKKLDELNTLNSEIDSKYGLSEDLIKFYFSMDKIIFPTMRSYINFGEIDKLLIIEQGERRSEKRICGSDFDGMYLRGYTEACVELENNARLFPENTKKYLLKKKEARDMINFDSLDNDFQARTFVSKFDDKFRIGKFRTALNGFVKKTESAKLKPTLINFHNAVYKKYSSSEDNQLELLNKFLAEIVLQVYGSSFWLISYLDSNSFSLLSEIMKDKLICNSFARAIVESNYYDNLAFIAYFISRDSLKEEADNSLRLAVFSQTHDNYLKIQDLKEEMICELIEIAKIQFLNKYKRFSKYLYDNNLIEDFKDKVNFKEETH